MATKLVGGMLPWVLYRLQRMNTLRTVISFIYTQPSCRHGCACMLGVLCLLCVLKRRQHGLGAAKRLREEPNGL
jgi:hypothetical protein